MALDLEKIDLGSFGVSNEESDPTETTQQLPVEAVEERPRSLIDSSSFDSSKLRSSLYEATKQNPDQYAEKMKLSRQSGIPSFAVEGAEKDITSRMNFDNIDLESLNQSSPGTAKFLSTFDNAAMAHDDVSALQRIEQILTATTPVLSVIKNVNKENLKTTGQTALHVAGNVATGSVGVLSAGMKAIGLGVNRPDQEQLAIYEGIARGDSLLDRPSKEFLYEPIDSVREMMFGLRDPETQQRIIEEMQVASGDSAQSKAIRRALFNSEDPIEQEQLQAALDQVQGAALNSTLYEMGTNLDKWIEENIYKNPELESDEGLKGFLANDVANGFGSVISFMATAMLTRGAASKVAPGMSAVESAFVGAAIPGSAANYAIQFDEALQDGATLEEAFDVAGISKYIGMAEGVPIMDFLGRIDRASGGTIGTAIKNMLIQGTEEAIQEGSTSIANAITRHATYDASGGFSDTLGEAGYEAGVGFTVGALLEFLGQVLVPGRRKAQRDIEALEREARELMKESDKEQQTIDYLDGEVEGIKLKTRSKESFEQFMQDAQSDGEKNIFINGEQVAEYLKDKTPEEINEDPALRMLAEQAEEAAALKGDVVLPLDKFASTLSGTDHYTALRPYMKMSPDTLTPADRETAKESFNERTQKLVEEAKKNSSQYVEAQEIYETVKDQLLDTGRVAPQQAAEFAKLIPAWATVHAARNGITVREAYERSGLVIEGPMTGRKAAIEDGEVLAQSSQPAYDNAPEVYNAVRDNFLNNLDIESGFDEVLAAEHWSPQERQFLKALDSNEWLGFDNPAGAIEAALSGDINNWEPSQPLKAAIGKLVNNQGVLFYQESEPVIKEFYNAFTEAKAANKNGASVFVWPEEDYRNLDLFLYDGGKAGFAITKYGDLVSVFKHPDSTIEGAMGVMVPEAIRQGARTLDAFEGPLTEGYAKYGFVEVGRAPFDPDLAPEGWDTKTMGTPDVVFMEISNEEAAKQSETKSVQKPERIRRGDGRLAEQGGQNQGDGRESDGSLQGLPRNIEGFDPKHNPVIEEVARKYMQSAGLPYNPPNIYTPVDPARAERIAAAFEAMEHNPSDPAVKAAYQKLIDETVAQYEAILETGFIAEFITETDAEGNLIDPYAATPRLVIDDINDNGHMWVFSTKDGFGSDETFDPLDNPLLQETKFKDVNGVPMLANDVFRVVHDYFGHAKEGVGFRAGGEENAWRSHWAMYSPEARKALTSETRGQNSWLNYGPYGETNRTAKVEDTYFADQKIGLLPDWAVNEGAQDEVFYQLGPRGDKGISTRLPTAKAAKEDSMAKPLKVGLSSSKKDRKSFEKNASVIEGYVNYRPADQANDPDKVVNRFISHVKNNLLWLYDQVDPDIRARSHLWYDGARNITDRWVDRFGVPDTAIAGVLASLSPQKDWFMNVSLAERVLETYTNKQDTAWSPEMTKTAARIFGKPQYKLALDDITGKKLSELSIPSEIAMWIRTYDEAHNSRSHRVLSPEGYFLDNATGKKGDKGTGWGSLVEIAKAVSVLQDPSIENINKRMGEMHKVRNFYNNIIAPNSSFGDVTIDTHAVAAGLLRPLSGSSTEVLHNFGSTGVASSSITGVSGTYGIYAEAYRAAAKERGVLPREMQSITWEAVRGLFPATYKQQEKNINAIEAIWQKYRDGKLSLEKARSQINEHAGGITPPDWVGSVSGMDAGKADSSYLDELPRPRVPGPAESNAGESVGRRDSQSPARGDDAGGEVFYQEARGYYDPVNSLIRLTEASDLTTFIHETAHFMYEMELKSGSPLIKEVNDWYKRNVGMVTAEANGYLGTSDGVMEQSKQAAEAAGFDTSKVWYHGTEKVFSGFEGLTFLTESTDEASAYAGTNKLANGRRAEKLRNKLSLTSISDEEFPAPVKYSGIIDDIDVRSGIWATDQGVVKFDDAGKMSFVENAVVDYDAPFDLSGPYKIAIKKGDGKPAYEAEVENVEEFISRNLPSDVESPNVIPAYIKAPKLFKMNMLDANRLGLRLQDNLTPGLQDGLDRVLAKVEELKAEGYDGIETVSDAGLFNEDAVGVKNVIIFDPSNIRSVNAAFDPAQAGSSNLLAQGQDTAGAAGPITEENVTDYLEYQTTGDAEIDAAIRRALHEHFARAFEQYVMEGKAPSIELQSAFRKIANWMIQAYKAIFGGLRKVNLDDQMRSVFDRLLATEEQIEIAQARSQFEPLFTDAAMAGMTDEEFKAYQASQQTKKDKANETLREKAIRQFTRSAQDWWKEEKKDVVATETIRIREQESVYRARDVLRGKDLKLDHATIIEQYGTKQTNKNGITSTVIPPMLRGMTAKGQEGVHPDQAAAFLGYESGAEMINDLINKPKLTEAADASAEAIMVERHGDIFTDGTIEQLADEAVNNDEKGKLILQELRALTRGTNQRSVDRAVMENLAEENIGKLSFREIHPGKYRSAEIKAAQEAAVELAAGNREAAARAKTQQAMNFYLGKAATKARDDIMGVVDWSGRYRKKPIREAITKAGNGYMDQIDRILGRFDLRKSATIKGVDEKNQGINKWLEERTEKDGDTLDIHPAVLNELYTTHWKNVPVADLRGIQDSVKNIEHVAKYSNKIRVGEEEIEFQKLVDDWTAHIYKQPVRHPKVASAADKPGKIAEFAQYSMAQMSKIPWMASWLDGGERVGMSYQVLVDRFEIAYQEEIELIKEHARPVMEAILNRSKEDIQRHNTKIYVPEIKGKANHTGNLMGGEVLVFALNTGNPSNLRKMLLGEKFADPDDDSTISFDNPTLQAVLKHMTESDWILVQKIWDGMNGLYPLMAEVYRKASGKVPPKVEAEPVETPFGTIPGGYYPMKYDTERSERADLNEERQKAQVDSMFTSFGGLGAETTTGAVNERTGFYDPIRLSLDVVPNHFQEVIHYITHYDAVRQTNKILRNHKVKSAIKETIGKQEYDQLIPWLRDIAKDGQESSNKVWWEKLLRQLRFGSTVGIMGFKATTGIIQVSGLSNSASEIGAGNLQKGIQAVLGSSSEDGMKGAWEYAVANSRVMGNRVKSMDREILTAMRHIDKKKGLLAKAQEASMIHIAYIQTFMIDLPTWHGAYIKGMEQWGDEQRAFQYADWVIQSVQGSGLTKDLPAIMRNQSESIRIVTMFMTFFSSLWNKSRDLGRNVRAGDFTAPQLAAQLMFMYAVPVLFEMIMRGDLFNDDEPEEQALHYLKNLSAFPIATVPFLRDASNVLFTDFGYNMSPITQMLSKGLPAIKEIAVRTFSDEEITQSQVKNATRLIGAALGVPGVYQMWATGEHLYEVMKEGEDFTTREVLFGPKYEE